MGDSLGVLMVLVLCGLALPIVLLVGTMLVDLVLALWWGASWGREHAHLPPRLGRLLHRGAR